MHVHPSVVAVQKDVAKDQTSDLHFSAFISSISAEQRHNSTVASIVVAAHGFRHPVVPRANDVVA